MKLSSNFLTGDIVLFSHDVLKSINVFIFNTSNNQNSSLTVAFVGPADLHTTPGLTTFWPLKKFYTF